MKSLALIGLAGLAANVQAHPVFQDDDHSVALSQRALDLSNYPMPPVSNYSSSAETKDNKAAKTIGKRVDYVETATEFIKKEVPGVEFRIVQDHYVGSSGVAHVNFKQTHHGIDIDNADFKVNVGSDGKIFSFGNNFFTGKLPAEKPLAKRDHTDAVTALKGVVSTLGLPVDAKDASADATSENTFTLKQTSGAVSDPEARLVYFTKGDGNLALAWRVETDVTENWLLTYVDAKNADKIYGVVDYVSDLATMEVFPWDVTDPSDGGRKVLEDPWNIEASPFTWFSDGSNNYTTTRGNNAIAQTNPSGGDQYLNNYRPNSPQRQFEYKYSNSMSPKDYVDFSVTQLFYTANYYHDLLYQLGFDESAGNFQANNNGKGGRGNDFVILNTQDGSGTNNANFATPPDGSNGRMRMYIWTASNPNRDSSLDQGVVVHEYTHGLSTRLTGGPSNSGCLRSSESGGMGEGWGDFMAVALSTKTTQDRTYVNNFGSWISNKPGGIRKYPYATSMSVNPHTYGKADNENGVHAIGNVWATILYEVLWNLIETHGNDGTGMPAFNNGVPTDGRFLTMKLVLDGMALQPCSPTMPQARDAIIDADKALTGGKNACDLWKGFAKRGLGEGASYSFFGRQESFTIPSGVC